MKRVPSPLQIAVVAFALLRGVGEAAMLQRWRLQAWLARQQH